MGRATVSPAEDETGALEEIPFHQGSAYDIGFEGGTWTARRRDGKGTLADRLPAGLRALIMADYRADSVPRDLP